MWQRCLHKCHYQLRACPPSAAVEAPCQAMADEIDNHAKSLSKPPRLPPVDQEDEFTMRRNMLVFKNMIELWIERLTGLRTMCATSSELTQSELRSIENKFIRMFAELLRLRSRMPVRMRQEHANAAALLQDWLNAIGLSESSKLVLAQSVDTVESLLRTSDYDIIEIVQKNPHAREVEWQRVHRANHNLRVYQAALKNGDKLPTVDLGWDSWDVNQHALHPKVNASPGLTRAMLEHAYKQQRLPFTPITRTPPSPPAEEPTPTPPQLSSESNVTTPEAAAAATSTTIPTAPETSVTTSVTPDTATARSVTPPSHPTTLLHSVSPPDGASIHRPTPSPSPPSSPSTTSSLFSSGTSKPSGNRPATPPPRRKMLAKCSTGTIHPAYLPNSSTSSNAATATPTNAAPAAPADPAITKSKSHELLVAMTASNSTTVNSVDQQQQPQPPGIRARLHTEPSPDNPKEVDTITIQVPRTPCTPSGTTSSNSVPHKNPVGAPNPAESIYQAPMHGHRFNKKFKLIATCDQCSKPMFFGLKCKECKFRCHKDCESVVRSSCGAFKRHQAEQQSAQGGSPLLGSFLASRKDRKSLGGPGAESAGSAESSCNSSTPSSPAPPQVTTPAAYAAKFKFPDVPHTPIYKPGTMGNITLEDHLKRKEKEQKQMQQAPPASPRPNKPRTISPPEVIVCSASSLPKSPVPPVTPITKDSALLHDSSLETTDNTQSEDSSSKESPRSTIRVDSTEEPDDTQWSRQNSVSLKEWDIPFEDIKLMEKIGDGRFGTVHRAQWHGAVAVKVLKEDYLDTEAFRMEVATFKKTRHENVVLFMGACINPQAIVTALCKGSTLYTHLHVRREKFNMSRTTMIAHQISRGMGYLHDRNITHKDLKSKNIFIENGRVIITDFALFSATKLEYNDRTGLCIPHGWLPYLAPEIMQRLTPSPPDQRDQLPFSFKSDVFAFGTIWYELLSQHFPYEDQCAESIIFKVGRGMKPPLTNIITSREVKEVMIKCWAYDADTRPDFAFICRQLDLLPKKRLARSPSHPIQLSRSAESVF